MHKRLRSLGLLLRSLWDSVAVKIAALIIFALIFFALGSAYGDGSINLSFSNNTGLPDHLNYASVTQVYNYLRSQYDGKLTTNQLLNGIKTGLTQATGDPYTDYFDPSQAVEFNQELNGTFSGIGAELEDSNNQLVVITPLTSSPAAKAGIQPKDIITAINGKTTNGMSAEEAADDIRGPEGTKVELNVLRGQTKLEFTITRSNITIPNVISKIIGPNIGYIQINQFSSGTGSMVKQVAQKLLNEHIKGIVLDLRNNPGGEVNEAVNVSSLWLPNGKLIMKEKRGSVVLQTLTSNGDDILHNIPTVVLINGGSASASEITASALHDNKAAYIIGTRSFGKGSVQQVDSLENGGELKVTIAHWYRPNGQTIEHIGIKPDLTVQLSQSSLQQNIDSQEQAAVTYLSHFQ